MALDRQSIERYDFPVGRRGYDTDAVDAHLARIADEVEELRRATPASAAGPVAAAASSQVQAIVDAAETTAAEIVRAAEQDAARIREDAIARSREHIAQVREATGELAGRVEALEVELGGHRPAVPEAAPTPPPPAPTPEPRPRRRAAAPPARVAVPLEPAEPVPAAEPVEPAPAAAGPASGGSADVEGARLVALNMALNGTSREETARYLAENFDLHERDDLLDEVYATVGS